MGDGGRGDKGRGDGGRGDGERGDEGKVMGGGDGEVDRSRTHFHPHNHISNCLLIT